MADRGYEVIPATCPECKGKITCDVPTTPEFAMYEPRHSVKCPRCGKQVSLELPDAPLRVNP